MTGSAKQSIAPQKERMDCFVASLLAMTKTVAGWVADIAAFDDDAAQQNHDPGGS